MKNELKTYIVNVRTTGIADIEVAASSPEEAVAKAQSVSPYPGNQEADGYFLKDERVQQPFVATVTTQMFKVDCTNSVEEVDGINKWAIHCGELMSFEQADYEESKRVADDHAHQAAFWKWKAEVILKIVEHPGMGRNSTCHMSPNFDSPKWEKNFLSGMTVDEAYQEAEEAFNRYGW